MRPLAGVRVLDLGLIVAGPMCAMYLASLGAEVVRIDRPDGDWTWDNEPFVGPEGERDRRAADTVTLGHLRRERGKRNVALDLKTVDGCARLRRLAEQADVLVENRRRGALDQLGVGRDELWTVNPRLVWCSIKGYAAGDPRDGDAAIDLAVQARAGLMFRTGDPSGSPMRAGTNVADGMTGAFAALGVLAALAERERTGRGSLVEVSLLDVLLALLWDDPLEVFAEQGALRVGNGDVRGAPCDVYPTSDGWVAIVATSTDQWRAVCRVVGAEDLVDRYPLPADRAAVRHEVDGVITRWTRSVTAAQAERTLSAAGVPAGAVLDPVTAVARARAEERGLMERLTVAGPGSSPSRFLGPRLPVAFDGGFLRLSPAEPLGASTHAVTEDGSWPPPVGGRPGMDRPGMDRPGVDPAGVNPPA